MSNSNPKCLTKNTERTWNPKRFLTNERGQSDSQKSTSQAKVDGLALPLRTGFQIRDRALAHPGTGGGGSNDKKSTQVNNTYAVPSSQTVKKHAPLRVNTVTVSVGVPSSYEKIWRDQNPAAAGAEPKNRPYRFKEDRRDRLEQY